MQQVISTHNVIRRNSYGRHTLKTHGFVSRFTAWCNLQEENRLLWLGISIVGGIGTVLPLTLLSIVFCVNNNFTLWVIACAFNVPVLVVNLAVQPAKVTLPTLFFAWMIDAIIIAYSLTIFFLN